MFCCICFFYEFAERVMEKCYGYLPFATKSRKPNSLFLEHFGYKIFQSRLNQTNLSNRAYVNVFILR